MDTIYIPQGLFKEEIIRYEDNGVFAVEDKYYVLTTASDEENSSSGVDYEYDESAENWYINEENCWDAFTVAICMAAGWDNMNNVSPPSDPITVTLAEVYDEVCNFIQEIGYKQTTQVFPDECDQIVFQRVD